VRAHNGVEQVGLTEHRGAALHIVGLEALEHEVWLVRGPVSTPEEDTFITDEQLSIREKEAPRQPRRLHPPRSVRILIASMRVLCQLATNVDAGAVRVPQTAGRVCRVRVELHQLMLLGHV